MQQCTFPASTPQQVNLSENCLLRAALPLRSLCRVTVSRFQLFWMMWPIFSWRVGLFGVCLGHWTGALKRLDAEENVLRYSAIAVTTNVTTSSGRCQSAHKGLRRVTVPQNDWKHLGMHHGCVAPHLPRKPVSVCHFTDKRKLPRLSALLRTAGGKNLATQYFKTLSDLKQKCRTLSSLSCCLLLRESFSFNWVSSNERNPVFHNLM